MTGESVNGTTPTERLLAYVAEHPSTVRREVRKAGHRWALERYFKNSLNRVKAELRIPQRPRAYSKPDRARKHREFISYLHGNRNATYDDVEDAGYGWVLHEFYNNSIRQARSEHGIKKRRSDVKLSEERRSTVVEAVSCGVRYKTLASHFDVSIKYIEIIIHEAIESGKYRPGVPRDEKLMRALKIYNKTDNQHLRALIEKEVLPEAKLLLIF